MRSKGIAQDMTQGYEYLAAAAARGHVFALRELVVQDLKGGRGHRARLAAPVRFIVALVRGLVLSVRNKDSNQLLG